jgi:hypothetical protein
MAPGAFRSLASDMLRRGHEVRFEANGTSMAPTIADGETVLAEPIDAGTVRLGDVVLCDLGARLVAHRLVRKDVITAHGTTTYVLRVRGDAPGAGVDQIAGRHVLGRLRAVERDGRLEAIGRPQPGRHLRELRCRVRRALDSARAFLAPYSGRQAASRIAVPPVVTIPRG